MGISRRASSLALALGLVSALLPGCWLQPGYGPERQSSNPFETSLTEANVGGLHQAWSVPTDFGGQPLVTPGAVVNGGTRGVNGQPVLTVRAVARGTGALLWQRDLPNPSPANVGAVLSVAGDEVLAARVTGFDVLDLATGASVASVTESRSFDPETVAVNGDIIAYRAAAPPGPTYRLVVRDRATFDELWTAPIGPFTASGLDQNDPVLIAGGHIYLRDGTFNAPVILGFDADGCGAATCAPTLTAPVPPPSAPHESFDGRLLAATDDGDLLVHRPWNGPRGVTSGNDLLALHSDGTLDWTLSLADLQGVAVAGDTGFAVGIDGATPPGQSTLFARSGSTAWRADGVYGSGSPIVAGGLVYAATFSVAAGTDVKVFDADGCGAPSCDPLTVVDAGPGSGGLYGMSVTAGTLFVNKAGPDGQVMAFKP